MTVSGRKSQTLLSEILQKQSSLLSPPSDVQEGSVSISRFHCTCVKYTNKMVLLFFDVTDYCGSVVLFEETRGEFWQCIS